MLDKLAFNFLNSRSEFDALNLVRTVRCSGLHHIGMMLGKFFEEQFPHSTDIKDEYAINAYYSHQYKKAYDIFERLLSMKGLSKDMSERFLFNQHFCIDHISDRYSHYNPLIVDKITNRKKRSFPLITLTITSCKRFDLFQQTVNSFLNCCKDLNKIDTWLCVDDNSSVEDREKMKKLYPFFIFYFKTPKEKGHPQSMNIIRKLVKTPYTFHMEDDWKFIVTRKYLTDAMDVMGQDQRIKQCLINKNYAETEIDINIKGGEFHQTSNGLRYYIHECAITEEAKEKWKTKHGENVKQCSYWPHFSFRPSLFRTVLFEELGEFNEEISHFEMDYSSRYINKGYVSAFLEGIYCIHIGRLTSERHNKNKPNAYELNGEAQFSGKEEQVRTLSELPKPIVELKDFGINLKTYVVNLDRREDRWKKFESNAHFANPLKYERYSAVDGSTLKSNSQLQRIFDGNDYNMRVGMVGCAMSHIKLYINLINSDADAYCILEDDITFVPEFDRKLLHLYKQVENTSWDMVYLGHHLFDHHITEESYNKKVMPVAQRWNRLTSLTKSMGGTGGYLISKEGAKKLLEFINRTGMTNGIDTVQQKAADVLAIYYTEPHLIYSECFRGTNKPDTDIQYNYDSLTVSVSQRLNDEILFYGEICKLNDLDSAITFATKDTSVGVSYYEDTEPKNVWSVEKSSVHPCYTLEDKIVVIVPGGNENRYFDRLKKNGVFNVEDALCS